MTRLLDSFTALFTRDLRRLAQEIDAYPNEELLWQVAPGINNPAGNLCLHLLGNLNSYIGAELGQTGYIRDRSVEFSGRDVPKAELLARISDIGEVITTTLAAMSDDQLNALYPVDVLGYPMTVHYFLTHLVGHFNYHLGQIDYHRRLLGNGQRVAFANQ